AYDVYKQNDVLQRDVHYVSCGKCVDKIKLDKSPPRKQCLPRLENVEKSKPIGACKVNQSEVANKLQIDYLLPQAQSYLRPTVTRCLYTEGAVFYYSKRARGGSAHLESINGGCVQTKDRRFYTAKGKYFIYQYCDEDGACTLYAKGGTMAPLTGGKTYIEEEQKVGNDSIPFEGTDVYLKDIVSVTEESINGGCVQTKERRFYNAKGKYYIYQYCDENGVCTLYAKGGTMSPLTGGKTYTEEGQKVGNNSIPFEGTDVYLKDIVSVTEGSCPPRDCAM
uniref:GON domain-containing protein n=1 Tax=Steinernema glaseri TaxID=37863 RepID=A0A1I7YNR1_9BILA